LLAYGFIKKSAFLEKKGEMKVCRYNWHNARSQGWPFPVLKYKYIFQVKYTEAILSNSSRKLLCFEITQMVRYGMVNVDLYGAIITKVSNALNMLVSGEKPGFQDLSKRLTVLLIAVSKNKFTVTFITIFGTLSFPMKTTM